jgi:hypothetical protein
MVSWNRGSWVRGVQAATTMRFSPFSRMTSAILSCTSWEQVNMLLAVKTTPGRVAAYSVTAATSTTPAMFEPQEQMKTPTRGGSPDTSRAAASSGRRDRAPRAAARSPPAQQAAALAATTDWGMSLGPSKAPQT